MKQLTLSLLLLAVNSYYLSAQTPSDKKELATARVLLDKKNDCSGAQKALQHVSDPGKASPAYLLLCARAFDCIGDAPQAIDHYLRYLSTGAVSDSVSRRLAELQKTESASRQRKESAGRDSVLTGQYARFLRHRHMTLGLASDLFTAGDEAPFGMGGSFFTSYELRFAQNRILLEPQANIGMMAYGHRPWYASALNTTQADITKIFNAVNVDFQLIASVVIINNEKLAIVAGPIIGAGVYKLQEVETTQAAPVFSSDVFSTPLTGVRLGLYLGKRIAFYTTYIHAFPTNFANYGKGFTSVTPTDVSSVRVGIGIRNLFW